MISFVLNIDMGICLILWFVGMIVSLCFFGLGLIVSYEGSDEVKLGDIKVSKNQVLTLFLISILWPLIVFYFCLSAVYTRWN